MADVARFTELLFGDQTLDDLLTLLDKESAPDGAWMLLSKAAEYMRRREVGHAAEVLLEVAGDPKMETRILLWSWAALRCLGQLDRPVEVGDANVPSIAGLWNVQVKSSKGESAWQLMIRQSAAEASAAILRIDGDTGTLTGAFRDGRFVLSHFSGARPLRLELTPGADGTLTVVQNKDNPLQAMRADQALAKGLPQPSDPSRFTSLEDPTEPLRFSFPDLDGRVVSNTDPRFAGKVVIVSISGSWCPNCHDETPFLVELYKKYKGRGLEVVALSFEEEAQQKNPVRLRAFNKRYGVDYTVLVPGDPKELNDKMPQGVNLNAFPTTFYLGRDGKVRSTHAGFPSKATGKFHTDAKEEITALVERLLAEPKSSSDQQ
jgi:thiol-disulfide isomerase/thioredoxin